MSLPVFQIMEGGVTRYKLCNSQIDLQARYVLGNDVIVRIFSDLSITGAGFRLFYEINALPQEGKDTTYGFEANRRRILCGQHFQMNFLERKMLPSVLINWISFSLCSYTTSSLYLRHMRVTASQITGNSIVCSQLPVQANNKRDPKAPFMYYLPFVKEIHRQQHKRPLMWKTFSCHDLVMFC